MPKQVIKTRVQGNGNIVNNTVTSNGNVSVTTSVNGNVTTSRVSTESSFFTAAILMMFGVYLMLTAVIHILVSDGKDMWQAKLQEAIPGTQVEASCSLPGQITFKGTFLVKEKATPFEAQSPVLSCVFFSAYTGETRRKLLAYLYAERASKYAAIQNSQVAVEPPSSSWNKRKPVDTSTLTNNISGQ